MNKELKPKVSKQEAIQELWRRGNLSWKCHAVQREMYNLFYNSEPNSTMVWLLARQSGKSVLLAILAIEAALRKPNSVIKLVTDTKLHVKSIFEPIFNMLLQDCPEELKPKYYTANFYYAFPNNSQIQMAGSDGKHYEKLRGQKSDLVLVDEAGFCRDLDDMIKSVLRPTTTHTGGRIILATTPPRDYDHPFIKFHEKAEYDQKLVKKTIYDNPLLSEKDIERIISEMGGVSSNEFRREYLCDIIKDTSTAVIPEFTPEIEAEIVKEWPLPPFYDSYVSMDLGFTDLTAVLFLYFDFKNDKIIIQDEIIADFKKPDMNIKKLTELIVQKESQLWLNPLTNEVKAPYVRVSDINHIVTNEIRVNSGNKLHFQIAKKDDPNASINQIRALIGAKKLIISPKCENLIRHLRNVKWKSANDKTTFARSADDGHYDAVDALKYGIRSIYLSKNPYPAGYGYNMKDLYINNPEKFNHNDHTNVYKQIFGIKRK